LKLDDQAVAGQLGAKNTDPLWAVAWKFPPMGTTTRVTDIALTIGKQGKVRIDTCAAHEGRRTACAHAYTQNLLARRVGQYHNTIHLQCMSKDIRSRMSCLSTQTVMHARKFCTTLANLKHRASAYFNQFIKQGHL